MVRWVAIAGSVVVVGVCASACSLVGGPATKDETCADGVARVCGPAPGKVVPGGGHFRWGEEDGDDPTQPGTPDPEPTATTVPPATEDAVRTVVGPQGISVRIPAGWTVGGSPAAANQQASDPDDPGVFARFGAAVPPDVPLLTEIRHGESGNPNVRNGYQRIQLVESSFMGQPGVDWEFTFVKDGVTRHAFGRYWRQDGLTYVIYLSAPAERWARVDWVFQVMSDSVTVH